MPRGILEGKLYVQIHDLDDSYSDSRISYPLDLRLQINYGNQEN